MREIIAQEVELKNLILPDDSLGMVVMQPFIEICDNEPFCWSIDYKKQQISHIIQTLSIARDPTHSCDLTHFTIFPEYAIPGLGGFDTIQKTLEQKSWPSQTVVIGGIDGLTKAEYATLCERDSVYLHKSNKPDEVRDGQWVNCSCTWVKTINKQGNISIKSWIQPKLCPSWPEENYMVSDMFEGRAVYVFEARTKGGEAFRFMTLLCFDWIGAIGSKYGILAILDSLNRLDGSRPYGKPLHLVSVLQSNNKPNHPSFLNNAYAFFNDGRYRFVKRDQSVIALINGAGASSPGKCSQFGFSSLIFSPRSPYVTEISPPSYATDTANLRQNKILQTCKEALFRENGECVHSFRLFHPLFAARTPSNRRKSLSPTFVGALDSHIRDPRIPNEQVPAAVKWVNDELDHIHYFGSKSDPLYNILNSYQDRIKKEIRWCKEERLRKMVSIGTQGISEKLKSHVDIWHKNERKSLETTLFSLVILSCLSDVTIKEALTQASFVYNNTVLDVIVVTGDTHLKNIRHASNCFPGRKERVTFIITRDNFDGPTTNRDKSIYDVEHEDRLCSFHDLKSCLSSSTLGELKFKIQNIIGT